MDSTKGARLRLRALVCGGAEMRHSFLLWQDREAIRKRLMAVTAADRGRWGVMTAGEMVCHLQGAFVLATTELPVEPLPVPMPRNLMKWVALKIPLRWVKNYPTVPELRRGSQALRTGSFDEDRAGAVEAMERFWSRREGLPDHAYFGPMTIQDWMRWGFLHTDHHLRQFGR